MALKRVFFYLVECYIAHFVPRKHFLKDSLQVGSLQRELVTSQSSLIVDREDDTGHDLKVIPREIQLGLKVFGQ